MPHDIDTQRFCLLFLELYILENSNAVHYT